MTTEKASASLQAYARCLALLADEIEAMQAGDTAKLRELAEQRTQAEQELGEFAGDSSPYKGLEEMADEALRELENRTEEGRRQADNVTRLEQESLPLLRGIRRWLTPGNYHELAASQAKFDVRL